MEARNIKINNNYVLVKTDSDHEKLKNGLYIGTTSTTEARHYAITGTVISIPNKLVYRGEKVKALRNRTQGKFNDDEAKQLATMVNGSMEYKTEIEVAPGDKVWFDYLAHINANTEMKTLFLEDHGECILIEYSRLFIRERAGEVIPINGWIWIKRFEHSKDLGNGLVMADNADLTVKYHAEVVKVGKPIKEYLAARLTDKHFDGIKPGDRIIFNEGIITPLEYALHETEGMEKLYKIKRKDIKALEGVLM